MTCSCASCPGREGALCPYGGPFHYFPDSKPTVESTSKYFDAHYGRCDHWPCECQARWVRGVHSPVADKRGCPHWTAGRENGHPLG